MRLEKWENWERRTGEAPAAKIDADVDHEAARGGAGGEATHSLILFTHVQEVPLLWRCSSCRTEWDAGGPCRGCWSHTTIPVPVSRDGAPFGSASARPHRRRYKATEPLADLLKRGDMPELFTIGYEAVRLPRRAYLLVTGASGSGKSTLCSVGAIALVLQGLRVLWISAEEGASATTARRFNRVLGWFGRPTLPTGGGPLISDKRALADVHDEIADFEKSGGDFVFLDSLQVLGADPSWVAEVAVGLGVVAISHQNGRGGPMGGSRAAYDSDAHVVVENYVARMEKSRWQVDGSPASWRVDEIAAIRAPRAGNVFPFPPRNTEVRS